VERVVTKLWSLVRHHSGLFLLSGWNPRRVEAVSRVAGLKLRDCCQRETESVLE
jgi:hypothetical protein